MAGIRSGATGTAHEGHRAVGFVDSAGEATSRSEADGLAQEGGKARAGRLGFVEERSEVGVVETVCVR